MARKRERAAARNRQTATTSDAPIPEDEQWRLINESGVLKGFKRPSELQHVNDDDSDDERAAVAHASDEEQEGLEGDSETSGDLADRIFDALLLIIPLCFLYAMMDMLARMQYAEQPTFMEGFKRTASIIPVVSVLVFYSNNRKDRPLAQAIMFCMSIATGLRLVWIVNKKGFHTVIKQSPPLSVIWVYLIIQLNLTPAMISLVFVYGLVKFLNLKLVWN